MIAFHIIPCIFACICLYNTPRIFRGQVLTVSIVDMKDLRVSGEVTSLEKTVGKYT